MQGNLLADATIQQIFTIEDGLISLYEISETETIQEFKRGQPRIINSNASITSFSDRF